MTFYKLNDENIIHTNIAANPAYSVTNTNGTISGKVYLEYPYLDDALKYKVATGFSERKGGQTSITHPITAAVSVSTAVSGGADDPTWKAINNLYNFYYLQYPNYNVQYNGSTATSFCVISIPQIYYDNSVLTGSFSASDKDSAGDYRYIYDDGNGGLYSGSLTGTLVGNIFYNEGIAVLKKPDLFNFGSESPDAFKWNTTFKGVHKIPVTMWRLIAPAGELNTTTNPTYSAIADSGEFKGYKVPLSAGLEPYITGVGIYDDEYNLLATVKLAQPVKKFYEKEITIKAVFDF